MDRRSLYKLDDIGFIGTQENYLLFRENECCGQLESSLNLVELHETKNIASFYSRRK